MSGGDWTFLAVVLCYAAYCAINRYLEHRERIAEIEHGAAGREVDDDSNDD